MKDQWFLDLDGVKSGPYQTNEVLSLISDGEVLPHHLIGTSLKAKEWKTILDWKLALSASRPASPTAPNATEIKQKSVSSQPAKNPEITNPTPDLSSAAPIEAVSEKKEVTTDPSNPMIKSDSVVNPETNQDAMAEMFDTIHHTKLKREQKSQQEHAAAQPILEPDSPIASSTGKFILVSIGITVLGFVLGQMFQKQTGSNPATSATTTSPAVNTTSTSAATAPASGSELQVLDRSNDRITIRSQMPMNPPPPAPAPGASMRPEFAPMERPGEAMRAPEKDSQMMEELKKELSELKALKEEIRNNEYSDELPDNNAQGNNVDGNAPVISEPNSNPVQNPSLNPEQAPEANSGAPNGETPAAPADEAHY
jgi:hypothetical protein